MFLRPKLLSKMLKTFANYADPILQIKVEYLDSSEITAFDLDDAIYVKGTLQLHHLECVTKSRIKFFFNSTYKKLSNMLTEVGYVSSSTIYFELEVTESSDAKNEDDCDTTLSNKWEIIYINIRGIVAVMYTVKKKLLKYLDVVQNIKSEYNSVQFLKHSGEKTFSVRVGDLDDCSQKNIKRSERTYILKSVMGWNKLEQIRRSWNQLEWAGTRCSTR